MFDIRMQGILESFARPERRPLHASARRAGRDFPVVHESLGEGAATLVGERTVVLRGQPVVEALLSGVDQVVQEDCPAASDDPAFHAMLAAYGGLSAQIVTAVRDGDRLVGIVSVHVLGGRGSGRRSTWDGRGARPTTSAARDEAPPRPRSRHARSWRTIPARAHNRLHPGIAPVATIDPGDELEADCRDGMDGELRRAASAEALRDVDLGANHPLTGPVEVRGARPGDVLVVELLALEPTGRDDGGHPRLRAARRSVPRAVSCAGTSPDGVARSANCPASRSRAPVPRGRGVAPSAELLARARSARPRWAAAALLPGARAAPCPQGAAGARACGRSRRARTAGTSTSAS